MVVLWSRETIIYMYSFVCIRFREATPYMSMDMTGAATLEDSNGHEPLCPSRDRGSEKSSSEI